MLASAHNPIFEGAQGVLLDQDYGFYPYITRSHVAPWNAVEMCEEADVEYEVTGLVRAYTVRHGPGPMPTFDETLTRDVCDLHNKFGEWQRDFRVGYFDAVMTRLAIDICCENYGGPGVQNLFVTCTDRLLEFEHVQVCNQYHLSGKQFSMSPYSLEKYGKEAKRKKTELISTVVPVYEEFTSYSEKSSLEYQLDYAKYVLSLIDRKVNLMGISCGVKAEDKYLM
jgi:adenylosuccinate synthase